MRVVTIAGLGWLPIAALAAWWMGFAPFPTRPEKIGVKTTAFYPKPAASDVTWFVPTAEVLRHLADGTGCVEEQTGAAGMYVRTTTCWSIQDDIEFFGWGTPRWLMKRYNFKAPGSSDESASRLYRTYAACAWAASRAGDKDSTAETEYERWAVEHNQKPEISYTSYSCVELPRSQNDALLTATPVEPAPPVNVNDIPCTPAQLAVPQAFHPCPAWQTRTHDPR